MATITASYNDHNQAQRALQALRQRGLADEHIDTRSDDSGGTIISVEVPDEAAQMIRDMLDEYRLPLGSPGNVENSSVGDPVLDDPTVSAAAAVGLGTAAAGAAMGAAPTIGALGGAILGAEVASELADDQVVEEEE